MCEHYCPRIFLGGWEGGQWLEEVRMKFFDSGFIIFD